MKLPVQPRNDILPLEDSGGLFTWETFERFFCAFLAAGLRLPSTDGTQVSVVSAERQGGRGEAQQGIDIVARMSNGQTWVFQCKHVQDWGPADTRDAIAACTYAADRKFLLVTKTTVTSATRAKCAAHPEWELWDGEGISRRFLDPEIFPRAQASRLLFTYFGPGWSEAMLGLPSQGCLVSAEAWFAPLLSQADAQRRALRATLVNRQRELASLDQFLAHAKQRVCMLIGPGGRGKTRLLREWTTHLGSRTPDWTTRLLIPSRGGLAEAIAAERRPLIVVLDDAHRFDRVRRDLMAELAQTHDVKILLCLRPGARDAIRAELRDAGLDPRIHLAPPIDLPALSTAAAQALVQEATNGRLSSAQNKRLAHMSRECPLIADLAGALLISGRLAASDIRDDPDFRDDVFDHLLRAADPVKTKWGEQRVQDLLGILALLAPVANKPEFHQQAAEFIGSETAPHHVVEMLRDLETCGILLRSEHRLTNREQLRITPDLLSDHVSYLACYDRFRSQDARPRSRGFVERLLEKFSADEFPRLLQHLAEAEWRAGTEADSVVEPLWRWFSALFDASSFPVRSQLLKEWRQIAAIQPRRTLLLARHVLETTTAPTPEAWVAELELGGDWNTHQIVVARLPSILQPVGEHFPEHMDAVLDLLWSIARAEKHRDYNSDDSALDAIAGILAPRLEKDPEIHRVALPWVERLLSGNEWCGAVPSPQLVLRKVIGPLFASTQSHTSWADEKTIQTGIDALPLANTQGIRTHARDLCRRVLGRHDRSLALAILPVLADALRRAGGSRLRLTKTYLAAWDREREDTLTLIAELIAAYPDQAIHFCVGRTLRATLRLRHQSEHYTAAARTLLATIPDRLELRLARLCLGHARNDMVEADYANHAEAEAAWARLSHSILAELVNETPDALALLARLEAWRADWESLDLRPNFRPLILAFSRHQSGLALEIARHLLANPTHAFAAHFDAWALSAAPHDPALRLALFRTALHQEAEPIRRSAINGLSWWRRQGEWPAELHSLLLEQTTRATPAIVRDIADFVWMGAEHAGEADWVLLSQLPLDLEPSLPAYVFQQASRLLEHCTPTASSLALAIIDRLRSCPKLNEPDTAYAFQIWAEKFPGAIFKLLWWRLSTGTDTPNSFIDRLRDANLRVTESSPWLDSEIEAAIGAVEDRFRTGKFQETDIDLLRLALVALPAVTAPRLERLIGQLGTPDLVVAFTDLFESDETQTLILRQPAIAKALLVKARSFGPAFHAEALAALASLDGGRGTEAGEPDDTWRSLMTALETAIHQHASDPELSRLYRKALDHENARHRRFMP